MTRENFRVLQRYGPWVIIILIIYGMAKVYPDYMEAARRLEDGYDLYRAAYIVGFFMIGVLFETERLLFGLRNGMKINIFGCIISVLILSILLLPFVVGAEITGFGTTYIVMQSGLFRSILGVGSGVIFIRSITADMNFLTNRKSETEETVT